VKVATGNDATTSNIIRFGRSRARLMRPPAWKAPQPDIEAELQSAVGLSEQQ
jgi:hypothetical protein